ncbi:MAG TPA: A/G-specific adenine glycosylase [Propionibacteriaceae bacterium]|nr:A/G-specific adenine glycosylase [Propionibacteriaceae bacterium]
MNSALVSATLSWYDGNARDLPWRHPDSTPWQVMVSEFMLQQTPVNRVLRPWQDWLDRWPDPVALAAAPAGEAVRAWGRLGYPRRALRLHAAATVITESHDGAVPDHREALLALPGVGSYTAAAILSFAYRQRHVVLDTNVRRVLARVDAGVQFPGTAPTRAETMLAERLLPRTGERAARWAAASMELGAVVCTARSPRCSDCPVRRRCNWFRAGRPTWTGPARRGQSYSGTDRQCRGVLLAALRASEQPLSFRELAGLWPRAEQYQRALGSLLADGLAVPVAADTYGLPR